MANKTFLYRTVQFNNCDSAKGMSDLNKMGQEGWELVSVVLSEDHYVAFLKYGIETITIRIPGEINTEEL